MPEQIFKSNLVVGTRGLSAYDLRQTAKADPVLFVHKVRRLVEEGHISLTKIRSLRPLWQALCDVQVPVEVDFSGAKRVIMASAFPILTGTVTIKAINDAYSEYPKIGDALVTEFEDVKKTTSIAAIHALDKSVDEVKPTDPYPEISADEEKVEIRHKPNGRRLSIHQDLIDENEMPDIVTRINALGEIAAEWVEELTLERVTDHYGCASSPGEPYVYRPNGTGTTLYSASANTPGTRAPSGTRIESNALVDESDLEAARVRLRTMVNNRNKRINIPWSEVIILVPDTVLPKLNKICNSEFVPGVENEASDWGPGGMFNIPPNRRLSTPKMDDLSTSAWYVGAFKRQFRRKWKLRFEYVTLGMDTQKYLESRIAFQARVAWDCEVGAVDYVNVIQCLSATTAPKDEA